MTMDVCCLHIEVDESPVDGARGSTHIVFSDDTHSVFCPGPSSNQNGSAVVMFHTDPCADPV